MPIITVNNCDKMEIKFFTIPNLLTLGNLLCGSCATVALLVHGDFTVAFWLVVAAAVCDFFDGFAARLLHSSSPIGAQLDSLADMVSFGLVPALALYCMYDAGESVLDLSDAATDAARYLTLIVAAFSALRLAKFNIDDTQHTEFCGLPTPAGGLLCVSLGLLVQGGYLAMPKAAVLAVAVVTAFLLISPIRMFALKFKGFGWRGNELRYSFIILAAAVVVAMPRYAVPTVILLYIAISAVRHAINRRKAQF